MGRSVASTLTMVAEGAGDPCDADGPAVAVAGAGG